MKQKQHGSTEKKKTRKRWWVFQRIKFLSFRSFTIRLTYESIKHAQLSCSVPHPDSAIVRKANSLYANHPLRWAEKEGEEEFNFLSICASFFLSFFLYCFDSEININADRIIELQLQDCLHGEGKNIAHNNFFVQWWELCRQIVTMFSCRRDKLLESVT